VLTAVGYDVVAAQSGVVGVALAGSCDPDLVLMDLQLPGIDGFEALRLLRQDPRLGGVPVVALTAFAMREDRERTARAGFDGYLSKPISVRELPSQVGDFLSNGRADVR
jgi:CheY-like chemotaxis protein